MVTGATGRVGQLAVKRILELYPKVLVRAVVNDFSKGSRLLKEEKDTYGIKLEVRFTCADALGAWVQHYKVALAFSRTEDQT